MPPLPGGSAADAGAIFAETGGIRILSVGWKYI